MKIEGRAYFLRPDTPKEGVIRESRPGETEDELSDPIRGQAKDANLIMKPPRVTPNTMYALEATEFAQQHGKFLEFHHAAYEAYWTNRKDLGDLEVIASVAESVDLDSTELIKHLENNKLTSTVTEQYQQALNAGIRGIPTFLVGNLLFTGAHPYEIFESAMSRILSSDESDS